MSKVQIAHTKHNPDSKPKYSHRQLPKILVTKKGRARSALVQLYVVINSRFKTQRAVSKCGKVISFSRLHTDALYTSREDLAKKLNKNPYTITKQLADLEEAGLILRDHEDKNGSYNKLKIYLLKDTPYFINSNGIELEKITHLNNHTSSEYIKEKYGIDRADKVPHLKLVESTDLNEGGIPKNADTNNTGKENISHDIFSYSSGNNELKKNNFYVVKNSETLQQKSSQQKSSLGDDFVAAEENLEKDLEFNCTDTVLSEPPKYLLTEAGLAKREVSYGHFSHETPIASDYVLGSTTPKKSTPKQEKTTEEKPMPTPQTNPRQELNCQILKTFPTTMAAKLQQKLNIKAIAPNKLGLSFNQELELSNDEKQRLRETIRLVYGDSVQIVLVKPNKPHMATKEDTAKHSETKALTPAESKWNDVKNDVLNSLFLDEKQKMQVNLNQVKVLSLEGRKLKIQATYSVCFQMENKQSLIETTAKKHNVDIEVKNTSDDIILYFPFIKHNLNFLKN